MSRGKRLFDARTIALMMLLAPDAVLAQERPHALLRATTAHAFDATIARPISVADVALDARDSLVALARLQVGRRYRLGGTSPIGGFDCSGLVRYVAAALRISLPRTAAEQARAGARVAPDTVELRPGDLLTFGHGRISHVGIYVGEGRMIHASSRAGRVIETKVHRRWATLPLQGARRVVASVEARPADWLTRPQDD